jgi:hypothetical protein
MSQKKNDDQGKKKKKKELENYKELWQREKLFPHEQFTHGHYGFTVPMSFYFFFVFVFDFSGVIRR